MTVNRESIAIDQAIKEHEAIIIGTGFSGLGMAIQLKQAGQDDFVVLEKAEDVGGTWLVNNYPGCACDVQSHLYSFSFEPNPKWSRMFATQPEILAYLKGCADKYGIYPHIRFDCEVSGAIWDEAAQRWTVTAADGQRYRSRVLISGIGGLSRPAYPDIPGIEKFKGKTFHSQQWDHDYDLKGKNVAVIGTGASAIQFVPQIAPDVEKLSLFQRTPPWVIEKPDREIGWAERQLYQRVPATQTALRRAIYTQLEARAAAFVVNPRLLKVAERWARSHLRKQVPDRALRKKLTPDYSLGCKRILISNDYYLALCRDNVNVITQGIKEIRANSIVYLNEEGKQRVEKVDAILFGTGFAVSDPIGPVKISGRDGIDLREELQRNGTEAYRGTTVHGFPNLFLLTGPNTGLGHNSMVYMIESQINYVMDALKKMHKRHILSVEPRKQIQDEYNQDLQARHKRNIWSVGGCKSWYLNEEGKNVTLWPGFTWQFRRQTKNFDMAAYHCQLDDIERVKLATPSAAIAAEPVTA